MENNDIRARIREVRKSLDMNQTEFAKKLGLTQTSLSMIESGKSKLTDKNIKLICVTYGVNEHWLATGEGEMSNVSAYAKEFGDIILKLMPDTQKYLLEMARGLYELQGKLLDGQNNDERR